MLKLLTVFLSLILSLSALPAPAHAWNRAGHMVSGAIAYTELRQTEPQALERVIQILGQHPDIDTRWASQLNKVSLTDQERDRGLFMLAARWPDDIRGNSNFDHPTWHYVNLPYEPDGVSTVVAAPPDAPGEENIFTAFQENLNIIESAASDSSKAIALCWMFHLLGDVHQPLHTSKLVTNQYPLPEGDRGGTRFYIRVRPSASTISLHKFWDDLILGSERIQSVRNRAIELTQRKSLQRDALPELSEVEFVNWAKEESFPLAQQQAYRNGTLVGSQDRENGEVLPADYVADVKPIAERRIVLSGYRIAGLLSDLF